MEEVALADMNILDVSDWFPGDPPVPSHRLVANSTVFGADTNTIRTLFFFIVDGMLDATYLAKVLRARDDFIIDTSNDAVALSSVIAEMKDTIRNKDSPSMEEMILLYVISGRGGDENYDKHLLAEWLVVLAENAKSQYQEKCFVRYILQHLFNDRFPLRNFRSTLEMLQLQDASEKGDARLAMVRHIFGGSTPMDTVVNAFNSKILAAKPESKKPNPKILPTSLKKVCNYWATDDFTKDDRASLQQVFETLTLAPVEEGT